MRLAKSKKNKNKAKLDLTVREEQRNKTETNGVLESVPSSNRIEIMADERWERLAEQQDVAYAKTVAEAMNLKLDMDNPADRERVHRAILDLVAGENAKAKTAWLKFPRSLWSWVCVSAIDSNGRTIWIADAYRVTISPGIPRTSCRSGCLTAR